MLESLATGNRADRVKIQARLSAIRHAIDNEQLERASSLLLNHTWQTDAMPELAMLSFAALEIGDYLATNDRAEEAISTYRLVLPPKTLIKLQRQKLDTLKSRYIERRKSLKLLVNLWDEFYRQIIASLESQLASLEGAADYTDPLLLRKGHAFLNANRPLEAWLIFESLSKYASPEIAAQAHYLWIVAAREANMLREAIAIAQDYIRKYPGNDESLRTLYLLGILLLEENRHEDAILAFNEVIQNSDAKNNAPAALFNRAFCYAALDRYARARDDFSRLGQECPTSPLAPNATIWQGLTHFFEGDYAQALDHFNQIKESLTEARHQAELLYRIACCQFALGNYLQTERTCETYQQTHKQHIRGSEVALLLGDARAIQLDFSEAIKAYSRVDRDQTEHYHHATLETANCLIDSNEERDALNRLDSYARIAPAHLAAEAYQAQIVFYRKTNQHDRAYAKLSQALEQLGNKLEAKGVMHCLSEMATDSYYNLFLDTLRIKPENGSVLNSRLDLAQALQFQADGKPYQSEVLLLEIAANYETTQLPEECLAHVGLKLAEIQSEQANEFLDILQKRYPDSEYLSFAYYAFSLQAERANDHPTTLAWLTLIPESSYHVPFYLDAQLLRSDTLRTTGETLKANVIYESILTLRWASGSYKAQALSGLAETAATQDKIQESIIYHQRIYTLYPAYTDIAADSYLRSAELFLKIDDPQSASKTCSAFMQQDRFATHPLYPKIEDLDQRARVLINAPTPQS